MNPCGAAPSSAIGDRLAARCEGWRPRAVPPGPARRFWTALDEPVADPAALAVAYAAAPRALGRAPLDAALAAELRALDPEIDWAAWTADDLGRAALVCRAAARGWTAAAALLSAADLRETAALLKALPVLPEPARWQAIAREGCRSNMRPVFDAIAGGNPYPARHFAPAAFDQMVLKALFVGAPVRAVVGLRARFSSETRRMVRDFRDERVQAGRPLSADHEFLLALAPAADPRSTPPRAT